MSGIKGLKRKAPPGSGDDGIIRIKKRKTPPKSPALNHNLLDRVYPKVQTLREYLILKLPSSSRLRRKKITSLGASVKADEVPDDHIETQLCRLLDTSFVASADASQPVEDAGTRWEHWQSFSQRGDESYVTLSDGLSNGLYSQSEIVDFVVWLLFSRRQPSSKSPRHILTDGFRRQAAQGNQGAIPGLFSLYPNQHVQILKEDPWPQLLLLLGQSGERIMIDLLADCAIFTTIKVGKGNLFQLSGMPVSEITPELPNLPRVEHGSVPRVTHGSRGKKASEIQFVKSRILYTKAETNARGRVHFGFRHNHVLNRCPPKPLAFPGTGTGDQLCSQDDEGTVKVLMYIFPRQFGLHNVFTSDVDHTKTAQKLQDYTLRENEIKAKQDKFSGKGSTLKIPKRLRGETYRLVQRLQVLHKRCAYVELLRHFCPTALDTPTSRQSRRKPLTSTADADTSMLSTVLGTQMPASKPTLKAKSSRRKSSLKDRRKSKNFPMEPPMIRFESLTDLATPVHQVSAFCQAVLCRIMPDEFWGVSSGDQSNRQLVLRKVDHFIRLRRFESMSLQEAVDGLKVTEMRWLVPPALCGQKTSQSDMGKRLEVVNEFLYYVFDSLLIPLIRSNFYVTESSAHRYKLFFFRHDVWRHVAEPSMSTLKVSMFEEVKQCEAEKILDSRSLSFSHIRLLPKGATMRPIMNLRRRTLAKGRNPKLKASINSILGPLYSVLRLEKRLDPAKLGASLFSVGDLYGRLKAFRAQLGPNHGKLYFAKVDVKSAFDTIPQDSVLRLMEKVTSLERYKLSKHAEVSAGTQRLIRRWHTVATSGSDEARFTDIVEGQLARGKRNTVFVDTALQRLQDSRVLLALLNSHIRQNLVKIGKKYYRQKQGIPQGSVLSSTLCNYFYADLERQHLGFLAAEGCLLLRLIDDFLLITTDVAKAQGFVQAMHGGLPNYGVTVNPVKTLVNFDLSVDGVQVARTFGGEKFPYCGTQIDCRTLDIGKNRELVKDSVTENGLTVEFGHVPGRSFQRKVFNAFKIQSHVMFYDTSHNSPRTVLMNLFDAFSETATKMLAYVGCLPPKHQPSPKMVADTIARLVEVAHSLLTSRTRKAKHPTYACAVSKSQVKWLVLHAMMKTLQRRQSHYTEVLVWLGREVERLAAKKGIQDMKLMQRVVA